MKPVGESNGRKDIRKLAGSLNVYASVNIYGRDVKTGAYKTRDIMAAYESQGASTFLITFITIPMYPLKFLLAGQNIILSSYLTLRFPRGSGSLKKHL